MRKHKNKRKKSSDSDLNGKSVKQRKDGGSLGSENVNNISVSDILSEASSVLYAEDSSNIDLSVFEPRNDTSSPIRTNSDSDTMATGRSDQGVNHVDPIKDLGEKVGKILATVSDIKVSQESMRVALEQKIDNIRVELIQNIDNKVKSLSDQVTLSIAQESTRIDDLLTSVQSLKSRIEGLENSRDAAGQSDHRSTSRSHIDPLNDPDLTITANGLPFDDGEDVLGKARALIAALGEEVISSVSITAARRLPAHFDKPGLVKISFRSLAEKVAVLRKKMVLRDNTVYRQVYIKSSKSHAERLIELNTRALLRNLPDGSNLRMDANGRLRQRNANEGRADTGATYRTN